MDPTVRLADNAKIAVDAGIHDSLSALAMGWRRTRSSIEQCRARSHSGCQPEQAFGKAAALRLRQPRRVTRIFPRCATVLTSNPATESRLQMPSGYSPLSGCPHTDAIEPRFLLVVQ